MSESEQPISSGAEPAGDSPAARPGTRRRGRRGGRGRRKPFAPRPGEDAPASETQDSPTPANAPAEAATAAPTPATTEVSAIEPSTKPAPVERQAQRPSRPERPAREPQSGPAIPPRRPLEQRPPLVERVQRLTERVARVEPEHRVSAIHQAIDEVMAVVEVLKRSVDQMEEVLELVEVAERQKLADEREIENLRRALRQFSDRTPDRPREQRDQRGGGRDQRAPRAPRPQESRDQRERRESQDTPDPRGAKDFREPHPEPENSPASEPSRNEDEPQQGS